MTPSRFIDLKLEFIETQGTPPLCKECYDEFWQNDLRSTDGLHPLCLRISQLRGALSRRVQGQKFLNTKAIGIQFTEMLVLNRMSHSPIAYPCSIQFAPDDVTKKIFD
jgi:hypothetical protein